MTMTRISGGVAALAVLLGAAATPAGASSFLILTGSGTSSLDAPLVSAGYTVINGTLAPGQIAANLAADTVGVYIWNDGSLGNTYSAANPALAFNAADQAALTAFQATHTHFIMDGLSWRANANTSEKNFSINEANALAGAGGGIVLGADDTSGALIVQHVNQVAGWFDINPFHGVYFTAPSVQVFGGSFFNNAAYPVDPTQVVGTTSYSEMPHGLQPNGDFLATALFGSPSTVLPYPDETTGLLSPTLGSDTFNGVTYPMVNHVVTTDIPGGGIDSVPEPAGLMVLGVGLGALVLMRKRA